MPYLLLLLPILAINLGIKYLANIDFYWQERLQAEIAHQELEAITRSSEPEYQLARHAGRFYENLEKLVKTRVNEQQFIESLDQNRQQIFSRIFPTAKVHIFHRETYLKSSQLIYVKSPKPESKRAMGLIFDHMIDQHSGRQQTPEQLRKLDKISENYFGQTSKTETFATSKKGKATYLLHGNSPHWFIWDYQEIPGHGLWGYFIVVEINEKSRIESRRYALQECRQRGRGLAGFVSLVNPDTADTLFHELLISASFKNWKEEAIRPFEKNLDWWLKNGPPSAKKAGKFIIHTHLGREKEFLSVFLSKIPEIRAIPRWMWLLNLCGGSIIILLSLRGLLLNQWLETRLTFRFLMLYFLAATLPIGLLNITASAYQHQLSRSQRNQIATDIESYLRQFETRKMQFQEEYRTIARKLFVDQRLGELIDEHGITGELVQSHILSAFKERQSPLPLMGFKLLDLSGKGLEYFEETSQRRLNDNFKVFRVPIISKLREYYAIEHPNAVLPEFQVNEEDTFGAKAFNSVSTNKMEEEIDKRRRMILNFKCGDALASQIHDYIKVKDEYRAALSITWNDDKLFEKTIISTIDYYRTALPDYAFVAFRNTQQGLKEIPTSDRQLGAELYHEAIKLAETTAARGSKVNVHLENFSLVAMPFGQNSEIIIAGCTNRSFLRSNEIARNRVFFLIIFSALLLIVFSAYFTAAFLLRPITELRNALELVARGNYSFAINSSRSDELGELTRAFSGMVEGLKERQRLATLLSDHAVEALTSEDHAKPGQHLGQRFSGIAMVSDIRGFTALCENQPTGEITAMLNEHFAAMAGIITSNGGRIYKFIGDAIEAVFTADDPALNAQQAVKSAIEMHCALNEINQKRASKGKFTYQFGVGVAEGFFYAGPVGSEDTRLDYAIIGETFNIAAQLEALSRYFPDLPVIFDHATAERMQNICITMPVEQHTAAMTFAVNDQWFKIISSKYLENTAPKPTNNDKTSAYEQSGQPVGIFQKNFRLLGMTMFSLFITLVCFGTYQGFAFRNQANMHYFEARVKGSGVRLAEQIKSEDSGKIAFELQMQQTIRGIESALQNTASSSYSAIIADHLQRANAFLSNRGINSRRFFAITITPKKGTTDHLDFNSAIACSYGLTPAHQQWFQTFLHTHYQTITGVKGKLPFDYLNTMIPEIFGSQMNAEFVSCEKYGSAALVKNGKFSEFLYLNHIRLTPAGNYETTVPEHNFMLTRCSYTEHRIAGMIMFSVPEEAAQNSAELIVSGYQEPGLELAVIDQAGKVTSSRGFPAEAVASLTENSNQLLTHDYLVQKHSLRGENGLQHLLLAYQLPAQGQVDLKLIAILLIILSFSLIAYVFRSLFSQTLLTRSILLKLNFSILLIAVIPMLTVAFVIDYFLTENHRALIHQQGLELQRYLETYELRQFYSQPLNAKLLQNLALEPEIIALAQKLDRQPDSEASRLKLRQIFAGFFTRINTNSDWENNLTIREAILLSRKDWQLVFKPGNSSSPGPFADVMGQLGKHLLNKLNVTNLSDKPSMQNVKSEMYYETGLNSVKSSFGDDSYIKITNSPMQLVELEVTTGAAGLMMAPLPSIHQPDYLLIWITSLTKGNYLSRIAKRNIGPFGVFSVQYYRYGYLSTQFWPPCALELERAATFINTSGLPVAYETQMGSDRLSIFGYQGLHQIDNFMIGAAAHTPIDQETEKLRWYFNQILLLAMIVFLFIGYQTASDIVSPIKALTLGMHQIALQNYFYRIALDRHDELGELCASFDRFARGLAEKEIMGKMVSRRALQASSQNTSDADLFLSSKRHFVFLFAGIPGFQNQLSSANSELLFNQLKDHVTEICRFIINEGGDIDKLMGDKILGVFPIDNENMAQAHYAAVAAAQKILLAEQSDFLKFPVAIGINSGEVISGLLGFGDKRDFTVIGDAVNVSARIQKEAESLPNRRCLFSEEVAEQIKQKQPLSQHSEVSLKGKSVAVKLFKFA